MENNFRVLFFNKALISTKRMTSLELTDGRWLKIFSCKLL